jgi:hypothetical protein
MHQAAFIASLHSSRAGAEVNGNTRNPSLVQTPEVDANANVPLLSSAQLTQSQLYPMRLNMLTQSQSLYTEKKITKTPKEKTTTPEPARI